MCSATVSGSSPHCGATSSCNTPGSADCKAVTLISCDALDFALETLGLDDPPLRVRLMDLYRTLDVFPEVPAMLKRLRSAGLKTAILSNGSPDHASLDAVAATGRNHPVSAAASRSPERNSSRSAGRRS